MSEKYPVHLYAGCPCTICDQPFEPGTNVFIRVSLCPTCGDKRCPGAQDHTKHKEKSQ